MEIPDHLTCLLGNLYAGQEATVRTGHATTEWFLIRKGVCQGCVLSLCFIDYAKAFDCVDHNKLWKILKEIGIPDHLTSLLRNLYQFKKQQLELDMEQWTGSKLGKEYIKAVYCHLAYLTYMQNTSCEMLDWMKHKLESRLPGEMSVTSDMQMTPPLWQKVKRN